MPVKGLCDAWAILEKNNHDVWIMFSVGSVSQHYWPIYQPTLNWYIGQVSALYRPSVLTNTQLMSANSQSSVSWILVKHLSICQPVSVSVKCCLSNGRHIDLYSINIQEILNQHLTNCLPTLLA